MTDDSSQTPPQKPKRFKPLKAYCAELGVCSRTGARRAKTDPAFPPILDINGRRYVEETPGEDYKAVLITRALAER